MATVYCSGPMSGLPDLNFPAFHAAAASLRRAGHEVVNPAELNPDPNTPYGECMRVDIRALCDCTGLALLPGYENSRGAQVEHAVAKAIGMRIHTVAEWLAFAALAVD